MGKTSRPSASGKPDHEGPEFDLLEQTVSLEGPVSPQSAGYELEPVAIPNEWLIEGQPRAREKPLAQSTDGLAAAFMWDCSSGRFHWEYPSEEIMHVLQGCAIVEISGVSRRLQAGDTHVFPGGSRFRWTVPDYVRSVTFRLRSPSAGALGRRLQAALAATWRTRRTPVD